MKTHRSFMIYEDARSCCLTLQRTILTMLIFGCLGCGDDGKSNEDNETDDGETDNGPTDLSSDSATFGDSDTKPKGSDVDSATDTDITSTDTTETGNQPDTEPPPEGCVVYVHGGVGSDGASGTSWEEAKGSIPAGLEAAEALECTEIWVAKGTYYAAETGDSANIIALVEGIDMYGGFIGSETLRTERDSARNTTQIGGSAHGAVTRVKGANDVILDGFFITEASTNGLLAEAITMTVQNCRFTESDIGIFANESILTIDGCEFESNYIGLTVVGGSLTLIDSTVSNTEQKNNFENETGMGLDVSGEAKLTVENTLFEENTQGGLRAVDAEVTINDSEFRGNTPFSSHSAGGVYAESAELTVSNTLFLENTTYNRMFSNGGAGMFNVESTVTIEDSSFEQNWARGEDRSGGAIKNLESSVSIKRTEFISNESRIGGAIYSETSTLEISECLFENNHSSERGAVYSSGQNGGTTTIADSTFIGNMASVSCGGVVLSGGEMKISDSRFENNQAEESGGAGCLSGGKDNMGNTIVQSSVFIGNSAEEKGGALTSSWDTLVDDCLFERNTADKGGAMFRSVTSDLGDTASVATNTRFIDNRGYLGGAVYLWGGQDGGFNMTNVLMNGNSASWSGGGIYIEEGTLALMNVTAIGNTAGHGDSAVGTALYTLRGAASIENSIVYNNPFTEQDDNAAELVSVTHSNLDQTVDGEGNISADPHFVSSPLATTTAGSGSNESTVVILGFPGQISDGFVIEIDNDGIERTVTRTVNEEVYFEPAFPTDTNGLRVDIWGAEPANLETDFCLQSDSPCVDSGADENVTETTDLDGNPRIVDSSVDMGAYEVQ